MCILQDYCAEIDKLIQELADVTQERDTLHSEVATLKTENACLSAKLDCAMQHQSCENAAGDNATKNNSGHEQGVTDVDAGEKNELSHNSECIAACDHSAQDALPEKSSPSGASVTTEEVVVSGSLPSASPSSACNGMKSVGEGEHLQSCIEILRKKLKSSEQSKRRLEELVQALKRKVEVSLVMCFVWTSTHVFFK